MNISDIGVVICRLSSKLKHPERPERRLSSDYYCVYIDGAKLNLCELVDLVLLGQPAAVSVNLVFLDVIFARLSIQSLCVHGAIRCQCLLIRN